MGTVAQLCFSKAWGGLEMSTVKMTRLFHEAGHNSICITYPDCPIQKAISDAGYQILTSDIRDYFSPHASRQISKWISNHNIQAIFLHSLRDLWIVSPALIGHPNVRLYGFARMFIRGVNKKDFLHRLIYSRLRNLIALSHAQKQLLLKCLPIEESKCIVIPNGVDTDRFQPRPPLRPRTTMTVGYIGRLDEQKGCMEFVEAAAIIHKQFPDVLFEMIGAETIGKDEPFAEKIFARIKELKLDRVVKTSPFRKDIEKVMNGIDIFCMPSYEENFANVLLEALASGLPCITTNSGGSPEMVDFGKAGVLVEPRSAQSLADGLNRILSNPDLAQRLARAARTRALEYYDIKRVFKQIEDLAFN